MLKCVFSASNALCVDLLQIAVSRSAANLFRMYLPLSDEWEVIDNSMLGQPKLIAAGGANKGMIVLDDEAWQSLERMQ